MRYNFSFTEEDLDILGWLLESEIKVQEMLIDESDGTLLAKLKLLHTVIMD